MTSDPVAQGWLAAALCPTLHTRPRSRVTAAQRKRGRRSFRTLETGPEGRLPTVSLLWGQPGCWEKSESLTVSCSISKSPDKARVRPVGPPPGCGGIWGRRWLLVWGCHWTLCTMGVSTSPGGPGNTSSTSQSAPGCVQGPWNPSPLEPLPVPYLQLWPEAQPCPPSPVRPAGRMLGGDWRGRGQEWGHSALTG